MGKSNRATLCMLLTIACVLLGTGIWACVSAYQSRSRLLRAFEEWEMARVRRAMAKPSIQDCNAWHLWAELEQLCREDAGEERGILRSPSTASLVELAGFVESRQEFYAALLAAVRRLGQADPAVRMAGRTLPFRCRRQLVQFLLVKVFEASRSERHDEALSVWRAAWSLSGSKDVTRSSIRVRRQVDIDTKLLLAYRDILADCFVVDSESSILSLQRCYRLALSSAYYIEQPYFFFMLRREIDGLAPWYVPRIAFVDRADDFVADYIRDFLQLMSHYELERYAQLRRPELQLESPISGYDRAKLERLSERIAKAELLSRMAQFAGSLRQHRESAGQYPESACDWVNPFTGEPITYERADEGFVLSAECGDSIFVWRWNQ